MIFAQIVSIRGFLEFSCLKIYILDTYPDVVPGKKRRQVPNLKILALSQLFDVSGPNS